MRSIPFDQERMTRKEAAAYLGVTPGTLAVWKSTRRYALPVVKVGRITFYRRSDLDSFIESRTIRDGMEADMQQPSWL